MKKIMVHGCYNTSNFGDLLLLDMVSGFVESEGDCIVLAPWISDAEKENIKARPVSSIFSLLSPSLAVLGGGGYFVDTPNNLRKTLKLMRYAFPALLWRLMGIPYVIVGVGVGPSLTRLGGFFVRFICGGAKQICVRDIPSKEILLSLGVEASRIQVTADLAICLELEAIEETHKLKAQSLVPDNGKVRIGIHFSISEGNEQEVRQFALSVGMLADQSDIDVFWFFDHAENNLSTIEDIVKGHQNYYLLRKEDHWTTAAIIGQFDAVVTTKLHVGIVAYALGAIPFGISSHGKTKRFFEQVGRSDFQTDYDGDFSHVKKWMSDFVNNKDTLLTVDNAVNSTDSIRKKSRQGYQIISNFIKEHSK